MVGHLELAGLVAIGAGEAALDVTEELRLEQRLGDAGAIDRHERLRAAARVVDGPGDDLLAGAALAGNEDLGVGTSDALDLGFQVGNRLAGADQLNVAVVASSLQALPLGREGQLMSLVQTGVHPSRPVTESYRYLVDTAATYG